MPLISWRLGLGHTMFMAAAVAQWVGWSLTTRHLMAGVSLPIGGYALPADSLGLASATLGATLALSVFGAGFADCLLVGTLFHLKEGVRASVAGWD